MFMEKVSVNGRSIAYRKVGAGNRTIIVETGLGLESHTWETVARALAAESTVLFYDRIGRGESDDAQSPRSTADMVATLRSLLRETGTNPPYIMVGHSFGGLIARLFSATYPDEMRSLILVESMHRDQFIRLGPLFPRLVADDPMELIDMRRFWNYAWHNTGSTPEKIDFKKCFAMDAAIQNLSPLPITVLTSDSFLKLPFLGSAYREKLQDGWLELQRELLGLSSYSKQVFAHGSGHFVQRDLPGLLVDVIKEASG